MAVLPNSLPIVYVRVKNTGETDYNGTVAIEMSNAWRTTPAEQTVELAPGQRARLAFSVERGREVKSNSYPIEIRAVGNGQKVTRQQAIVVASAPYYKPTIDGDPSDWKDAIPVVFSRAGRKTTISTYWSRRQFSVLIAVEEDQLIRMGDASHFDAVQLAIAPQGTVTGKTTAASTTRFEYLLVAQANGKAACYELLGPGRTLADAAATRPLDTTCDKADVVVSRHGRITYYECSLSFAPMRKSIRPGEGREFFLSVLVHDPDGTGIRDWGEAAGLWESQRNRLAWSQWAGAKWRDKPPMDCRTEWGMCSSRY
jgi:hypothetical protein